MTVPGSTTGGEGGRVATYADGLERFGDRVAIVTEAGEELTYRQLAERADAFGATLGTRRRLLAIEVRNEPEAVVALLGGLRHGHPVLLLAGENAGQNRAILDAYAPDASYRRTESGWALELAKGEPKALHPDLAVLLSTSGSTGAVKLVRLSHRAIEANAGSIAEYLRITEDDAPITSLAIHYSYGLSVVASHLSKGARLLLTGRSVIEPGFWDFFRKQGATALAGVPYTYELLERVGFRDMDLPTLRTLTQAGGRLPPDLARQYAAWAEARGVRFFVMYGQTEATARMAYMPPDLLAANPGAIGLPIPGGAFRLLDETGQEICEPDVTGELIYVGPNVMMGYAAGPGDLAAGPTVNELHTGDLACCNADGLYRIVGRKSRFSKLFGLRIGLDDVEHGLREAGVAAHVTGDDTVIAIAVTKAPSNLAEQLGEKYGLPANCFAIVEFAEMPTLPSGKIDYRAILQRAKATVPAAAGAPNIAEAFERAFPGVALKGDDSFVSLGGNSLNYVSLSLDIERALGSLPNSWEELTLDDLGGLRPATPARRQWWRPASVESEVLLRALAILTVVINHASALVVGGGAEALLVLVGYNMARYQRRALAEGHGGRILLGLITRIILPYYGILLIYFCYKRRVDLPSLLLASNMVGRFGSFIEPYWFIEVLFQCTLVIVVLFMIPAMRRMAATTPWRLGLGLLAGFIILKVAVFAAFHRIDLRNREPEAVLYLVALGWCLQTARARSEKLIMTAIGVALAAATLGAIPSLWFTFHGPTTLTHAAWLAGTVGVLLWAPRVVVPQPLKTGATLVAAASFYIYLTHGVPVYFLVWVRPIHNLPVVLLLCVVLGLLAWKLAEAARAWLATQSWMRTAPDSI